MTSMNLIRKVARRLQRVIQPVQPPLEPPRVPDPAATRRLLMTTGLRVDLSSRSCRTCDRRKRSARARDYTDASGVRSKRSRTLLSLRGARESAV